MNKPTYQGRRLDRPYEEIVDQGLPFDMGTILSRRRILGMAGAGAMVLGVAACGSSTGDSSDSASATDALTEIPEETAGPYPGDGSNGVNVLDHSGIVRSDIRSSFAEGGATAEGVPMTLELTIYDLANNNARFEGVAVYVWHCDRDGNYSLYSEGVENENYLRGVQVTDADGVVSFTSVFPACYSGRWPHIHFEVYPDVDAITDSANVIATSQVALPKDICETVYAESGYEKSVQTLAGVSLDSDNVFSDDDGQTQLAGVTGDISSGYNVTLAVGVDIGTEAGGGPGGDGQAPPGGS